MRFSPESGGLWRWSLVLNDQRMETRKDIKSERRTDNYMSGTFGNSPFWNVGEVVILEGGGDKELR